MHEGLTRSPRLATAWDSIREGLLNGGQRGEQRVSDHTREQTFAVRVEQHGAHTRRVAAQVEFESHVRKSSIVF